MRNAHLFCQINVLLLLLLLLVVAILICCCFTVLAQSVAAMTTVVAVQLIERQLNVMQLPPLFDGLNYSKDFICVKKILFILLNRFYVLQHFCSTDHTGTSIKIVFFTDFMSVKICDIR